MSSRPNLLFLFSDQHTQKLLGCYGDPIVETPNLDKLAESGVLFENAHCASPLCVPSRMSLLTGRYPSQQEVWMNDDILSSDIPTYAHALGAAGYKPRLFGRMHSMGPDQLRGYVDRECGDHSPNWIGASGHDMGPLKGAPGPGRSTLDKSGIGQSAYELKDADTVKAAVEYFEHQDHANPFCVTVGFMLPHAPYVASRELFEYYRYKVGAASTPIPDDEHPWLVWWRGTHSIIDVPEEDAIRARISYYALVHRMDQMIGEILEVLKNNDLLENTLIAYASDHGEHIGERGLWWKHTFYNESVQVPLILSWPDVLPAGQKRDQIVNLVDLNATFLDALGAQALPFSEGKSLLDIAKDSSAIWSNETYSEYCSDDTKWDCILQRMVRKDEWKLVYYHGYAAQLFNLENDPNELDNLADKPEYKQVQRELLTLVLKDWSPEAIYERMMQRRKDKDILCKWAQETSPKDQYRWFLKPEMNRLEND